MNTDFARPATRYRNEAVFRSAQRLLACRPPKKARKKFPRWLVFAVGLVVGIGLAIGGLMFWSRILPESAIGRAVTALEAKMNAAGLGSSGRPLPTSAPSSSVAIAVSDQPAEPRLDESVAPNATETSRDRTYRADTLASLAAPLERGSSAEREAATSLLPGVTHYVAIATLRGEMRAEKTDPVSVEFTIRRLADGNGSKLLGVVRILNGNVRLAANTIAGEIHDHTMSLRETAAISIVDRTPLPFGRTFEIHLPAEPTNAEITGTWRFGPESGTLALKVAPPW